MAYNAFATANTCSFQCSDRCDEHVTRIVVDTPGHNEAEDFTRYYVSSSYLPSPSWHRSSTTLGYHPWGKAG